jgi:hypothetical protein
VRHAVTVRFMLRGPAKLTFVIQGPAPSCDTVRKLAVKGHRGINRLQISSRVGGRPLHEGIYRVVAKGQPPAKVLGLRVRKDGRIVPVKTEMLPAGWCVARYAAFVSTVIDVLTSIARPPAFAPPARAVPNTPLKGEVRAARAESRPLQIGPAKLALGVVKATTSGDGNLFRWFAIAIVGFLALSFPAVLVAAAWRDLMRRGSGRLT